VSEGSNCTSLYLLDVVVPCLAHLTSVPPCISPLTFAILPFTSFPSSDTTPVRHTALSPIHHCVPPSQFIYTVIGHRFSSIPMSIFPYSHDLLTFEQRSLNPSPSSPTPPTPNQIPTNPFIPPHPLSDLLDTYNAFIPHPSNSINADPKRRENTTTNSSSLAQTRRIGSISSSDQ